jgi:hypothetical protein
MNALALDVFAILISARVTVLIAELSLICAYVLLIVDNNKHHSSKFLHILKHA